MKLLHSCINRKLSSNLKLFLAFLVFQQSVNYAFFRHMVFTALFAGGGVQTSIKFSKWGFAGKKRVNVFQEELQFIHIKETKIRNI